MNKDVVYIEPEDDITDVINRIKSASQKVVALVPPKKMGVLRSTINIKLISKAAKQYGKVVVIVTMDPSVLKLAAVAGLPVAKNLQSRPVIPKIAENTTKKSDDGDIETITEEDTPSSSNEKSSTDEKTSKKDADLHLNSNDLDDETEEKSAKGNKTAKGTKKGDDAKDDKDDKDGKADKKIPNFDKYRKYIIIGAGAFVALVALFLWIFGFSSSTSLFAGPTTISVKIRTNSSPFSENATLVTKASDADAANGKLLLEKVELSKDTKTEFTPTGEKDVGNKASGSIAVSYTTDSAYSTINIAQGTVFEAGDLVFTASESTSIPGWDGQLKSCPGGIDTTSAGGPYCVVNGTVNLIASEGGTKYNISAGQIWANELGLGASNASAFSGGTSEIVKVVTKEDVEKAKEKFSSTVDGKNELLEKIDENTIAIESSYASKNEDPVSSPAIGEKVTGDKATLTLKTTYSIYVVSKSSASEFIKTTIAKNLGPDQIIYDAGNPFFERFVENNGSYSAKLKSTVKSGPKVSQEDILEKSRGKKIGEIQSLLQSINGVSTVSVTPAFPWVNSVPDDDNKIIVSIEVEETKQ